MMKKDFTIIILTIVITLAVFYGGICTAKTLLSTKQIDNPVIKTTIVKSDPNPMKLPILNIK